MQRATCIGDEEEQMGRCRCGGQWSMRTNMVEPRVGRWFDHIGVVCARCGRATSFVFDISSWFEARPGVWNLWCTPEAARSVSTFDMATFVAAAA